MTDIPAKLSPEALARYRTISLTVVSWLLVWTNNAWGIDIVDEAARFFNVSESTVQLASVALVSAILYRLSQWFPIIDKVVHAGADATPTYPEARE